MGFRPWTRCHHILAAVRASSISRSPGTEIVFDCLQFFLSNLTSRIHFLVAMSNHFTACLIYLHKDCSKARMNHNTGTGCGHGRSMERTRIRGTSIIKGTCGSSFSNDIPHNPLPMSRTTQFFSIGDTLLLGLLVMIQ